MFSSLLLRAHGCTFYSRSWTTLMTTRIRIGFANPRKLESAVAVSPKSPINVFLSLGVFFLALSLLFCLSFAYLTLLASLLVARLEVTTPEVRSSNTRTEWVGWRHHARLIRFSENYINTLFAIFYCVIRRYDEGKETKKISSLGLLNRTYSLFLELKNKWYIKISSLLFIFYFNLELQLTSSH